MKGKHRKFMTKFHSLEAKLGKKDVVKKTTEHHLCRFVESGKMHNTFMKALRPDGMGIDYSKIDFRFKDPMKNRGQ